MGDDLATDGFIQYNSTGGSVFDDWGTVVAEGSACVVDCPRINGQLTAGNSGGDAFLTLEITETDLTLMPGMWRGQHSLSGVADGSLMIEAFWDAGNGEFAKTNSIGGPFAFANQSGFESFSKDLFDTETGSNPFSMTTVITFNNPDAGLSSRASSSAALSAVPLPAALPLLGAAAGIFGIAGFRRRG